MGRAMSDFSISDPRTAARGAWLFDRIVSTGSLVLREVGETRAGEMATHRYLSSPHVTTEVIVSALAARTQKASAGRRVVAAQDTTEINFSGRSTVRRGLGPGGDGTSLGFFLHPVIAVDVDQEAVLGLVGAQIWSRGADKVSDRHSRACEDRESARWLEGTRAAAAVLEQSTQVICVADREGDIWSHFAQRPEGIDLAIRARHDRPLEGGGRLFEAFAGQSPLVVTEVEVAPRGPGDKGRIARVALRCGTVRIRRPAAAPHTGPKVLELGLVEAIEEASGAAEPLLWRIVTTLPVEGADDAREVIRLYRLRWRIEEVFRALKRDGLALEETQVQDAKRLFHLSALALGAAVRIIQLVDARDGGPRPMSDVLDPDLHSVVAVLVRSREGATDKQKNPHPQGSLAWLAWLVARYGGWNCYGKPPGPKTMAKGWQRFAATIAGAIIATENKLP
jgi:Transposase DDE domain